jgi:hypothetical protein
MILWPPEEAFPKLGHFMHQTICSLLVVVVAAFAFPCQSQSERVEHFDLQIENGRLMDSRKVIAVRRYDRVEINWRADRRTILHLHGYDIEITIEPDKPEMMTFVARATGRFGIEIHPPPGEGKASNHHAVLIYLEVHPR